MLKRKQGFLLSLASRNKMIFAPSAIESIQKISPFAPKFCRIVCAHRNRKRKCYPCNRRMYSGFMNEIPESNSHQQIWPQTTHSDHIESDQNSNAHAGSEQCAPCDRLRIENRDD